MAFSSRTGYEMEYKDQKRMTQNNEEGSEPK